MAMSDVKPDVMEIAVQYREELQSKLARVDAFIKEAGRLTRLTEKLPDPTDPGLLLPGPIRSDVTLH